MNEVISRLPAPLQNPFTLSLVVILGLFLTVLALYSRARSGKERPGDADRAIVVPVILLFVWGVFLYLKLRVAGPWAEIFLGGVAAFLTANWVMRWIKRRRKREQVVAEEGASSHAPTVEQ